jgi:hypothetical protein
MSNLQAQPQPLPDAQAATHCQPLQLEISLAEAWPWPGMVVRAAVRYKSALIRLRKVRFEGERIFLHDAELIADRVDALVLRTLAGLPTLDGVAYRVSGRAFAPVLALIRKGSGNLICRESERLARVRVLSGPPKPALALEDESNGSFALRARPSYRCPQSGAELGLPLERGTYWWTFPEAVTHAAEPLEDALLARLFAAGESTFHEQRAEALLRAARAAGPALLLARSEIGPGALSLSEPEKKKT